MSRLDDLDRKTKHVLMKTHSNVFGPPSPSKDELLIKRKRGAGSSNRGSMGSILTHLDGPGSSKIAFPSRTKKTSISVKPQDQSTKEMNRSTFVKVMTAKKDNVKSS